MLPAAPRVRAARWSRWRLLWLVGLVIAGVFTMHVLDAHDHDDGHSVAMPVSVGMPDGHAMESGAQGSAATVASPGRQAGQGMAACILFLIIAAGLVLTLLLQTAVRWRRSMVLVRPAARQADERAPPRHQSLTSVLCVQRV